MQLDRSEVSFFLTCSFSSNESMVYLVSIDCKSWWGDKSLLILEHFRNSYYTIDLFRFVPCSSHSVKVARSELEKMDVKGKAKYRFYMNGHGLERHTNYIALEEIVSIIRANSHNIYITKRLSMTINLEILLPR
jgi:hypothetical protein